MPKDKFVRQVVEDGGASWQSGAILKEGGVMPMPKKTGIAVGMLALAVLAFAAWLRLSPESAAESSQAVSSAASHQASNSVSASSANSVQSSASATPAAAETSSEASSDAAMVRPEDAIVAEPVDNSVDDNHAVTDAAKPSPEVLAGIREMKKPTADEGKVTVHADGSQSASLGNRYKSVPVATRDKDGKLHVNYHGEEYIQEEKQKEKH